MLNHYEPQAWKSQRYAAPLQKTGGIFGEHFGESPHFTLVEIDIRGMKHNKQEIVANPSRDLADDKGQKSPGFS